MCVNSHVDDMMGEEGARVSTGGGDWNAAAGNSGMRKRGLDPLLEMQQEGGARRQAMITLEVWVVAGWMSRVRKLERENMDNDRRGTT